MSTRIYSVTQGNETVALIRARSSAEALRHHTANLYSAGVATDAQLITATLNGLEVQDAQPVTLAIVGTAT